MSDSKTSSPLPGTFAEGLLGFAAYIKSSGGVGGLSDADCEMFAKKFEEAADELARLTQALAMANTGGLKLIYNIRTALGWNDKTGLDLLPGGVRDLRKAITAIRNHVAYDIARLEEQKARGDLTKDWGEAHLTTSFLMLREIDRILSVNRVDGIAP